MRGRGAAAFLLLAVLADSAAAQAPAQATPAPASPTDFSGTWKLDESASANVSPNMKGAVLVVEQKGDHIRVTPTTQAAGKILLAGEEIVVDGRPYEKGVGGGKAVVTARWSADRRSLEIETSGTEPAKQLKMLQISHWSLSTNGATWLRETKTTGNGKPRLTRLVFRRQAPEPPSPKTLPAKPSKK